MKPSLNKVPKHVAIVLDGNRRFAKRLMLKPFKGHEWGAKKIQQLFEWCKEFGIHELTLYAFSVENFNRPKAEFDYLMNLFVKEFQRCMQDARIHTNKIRINFVGRVWMFPKKVQDAMQDLVDETKNYSDYVVNFAMGYGGRQEIVDAVNKILKTGAKKVDEKIISENLYLSSEPDMIIRTGGEQRTSNFLPWQGIYSEYIFLKINWPEFEKEDFVRCITEFGLRERRFGR